MIRMLVLALVLGVLGAAAGSAFLALVEAGQDLMFTALPEAMGWSSAPWWLSAILLLIGATGVALARRLPGATGNGPLTGFHFDDPLSMVPSVLLAALFTLVFGLVLGPEAPLIVLGTAVGAIIARRAEPQARRAAMLLGGVAAIGAVLGNPFVTGFMILEFAAAGLVPAAVITPVFVALGAGYLTQIGIFGLPGFGVSTLAVPGLPAYPEILPGDILRGLLVAVIAAIVAVSARSLGVAVDRVARRRPVPVLYGAAIVTALILLVAEAGFGLPQEVILFSGVDGMGALVAETSVTAVIVILVGKAIAYGVALGGGYRGGPIFPATFLGVGAGVLLALLMPDGSVSPLAAAGIAAAVAAMLRLPATSALLAVALVADGGVTMAPFAIFGAVVGIVVRMVVDKRLGGEPEPAAPAPDARPSAPVPSPASPSSP